MLPEEPPTCEYQILTQYFSFLTVSHIERKLGHFSRFKVFLRKHNNISPERGNYINPDRVQPLSAINGKVGFKFAAAFRTLKFFKANIKLLTEKLKFTNACLYFHRQAATVFSFYNCTLWLYSFYHKLNQISYL